MKYILDELGENNIPIKKSWRLNERHYGALKGLNKNETKENEYTLDRAGNFKPGITEKNCELVKKLRK